MKQRTGKIDNAFFTDIFQNQFGVERNEVVAKPQFGVDVSVIQLSNGWDLAVASDPLSLIPQLGLQESAWLSVQLTANDIATTGFAPQYGQMVLNMPAEFSVQDLKIYWQYIHQYCKDIGLTITGGHTGFIQGQHSTIAGSATFFVQALRGQLLTTKNASKGDKILVTKTSAISSAAILAMSFPETVKSKTGVEFYQQACEGFYQMSVLKDALTAVSSENKNGVTAIHDVTEGGVLGAIYELAKASGNGAFVEAEKLPIAPAQKAVCALFSLEPTTCIGAGALVITCKAEKAEKVIQDLDKNGIDCVEVGALTERESGFQLIKNDKMEAWAYQSADPYWSAFYKALKMGWK